MILRVSSKIKVVETKTGKGEKEKVGKDAEERLQNFAKQMLGDAKRLQTLKKQLMDQQRAAEMSKQREAESAKEMARQEETIARLLEEMQKLKKDVEDGGKSWEKVVFKIFGALAGVIPGIIKHFLNKN